MKRGLSFGFVSLIVVFVLALFLVSGFSFKTFTGKITGHATGDPVQIEIPSGQTGTATCLAKGYASCSRTFYYLDGILTSDENYLCSDAKIYSSEVLPHWAECVPVSSGGGDVTPKNPIIPQTTCSDGTPVGALGSKYGNTNYQYLCADKDKPLLICGDQDFNYNPADQSTYTNPNVGAQLHGWTCERWGWLCGGKVSSSGSGYCCGGVNQQTPCSTASVSSDKLIYNSVETITITAIGKDNSGKGLKQVSIMVYDSSGKTKGGKGCYGYENDKKSQITCTLSSIEQPTQFSTPGTYYYWVTVEDFNGNKISDPNSDLFTSPTFPSNFKNIAKSLTVTTVTNPTSCENYYSADLWSTYTYLPAYDPSLLVACDSIPASCPNKYDAVYNGKCYSSSALTHGANFHRTVQKNVGFTGGNDLIALTFNNGNPDPNYSGKWIDCDTTAEHCTACDNEIPTSWANDVNKNLNTSNNIGGIPTCIGAQCWIKSGESVAFSEYKVGATGCCGDDANEYFVTTKGISACCNDTTDIVDASGNCLPLGTIKNEINSNLDCTCAIYDFVTEGENKGKIDIEDVTKMILCMDNPKQAGCPSIKRMDVNNDGKINKVDLDKMSSLCDGATKLLSKDCDYDAIDCQGCILGSNCIKAGTRATLKNTARYCSVNNHWLLPQSEGVACSNDYECTTNVCVDGNCLSIKKELEKQAGLLKQIWCSLTNPVDVFRRDSSGQTSSNNNYLKCVG